jgi:hypothetical protein
MLKDLGLDPSWDKHDFADQEEKGCGNAHIGDKTQAAIYS